MGDPVLMTEHLNIQFPSLREARKSYIFFKVKRFSVKEVGRQHLHRQVYLYFACIPVWVILFPFLSDGFEEPLPWLHSGHNGLM